MLSVATFVLGSASQSDAKLTAKSVHIVDCLLPGKVRKLGLQRTYVTRKKPVKTSSNDCAIRGGDYTEYDRANIQSALAVWQGSAVLGDAQSQYYVGEIFENGYGGEPNYQQAHHWYQQAANQDYAPALMSIGRLYEAGKGVEKDLVKAMNYYRQASGLSDERIEYASVFENIRQQDLGRISVLETELESERAQSKRLTEQLSELQQKLASSKDQAAKLKQEIDSRRSELQELNAQLQSPSSSLEVEQLNEELASAKRALNEREQLISSLKTELNLVENQQEQAFSAQPIAESFLQEQLTKANDELALQQHELKTRANEIANLKSYLEALQGPPVGDSHIIKMQTILRQLREEKNALLANSKKWQTLQTAQSEEIERLKQQLASTREVESNNIVDLQSQLAKVEQALTQSNQERELEQQKISQLEQDISALSAQNATGQEAQNELAESLKARLVKREEQYQQNLADLDHKLHAQNTKVENLQARLLELRSSDKNKQQYIQELTAKLSNLQDRQDASKLNIESKDTQLKQAFAKIGSLEERIASLPKPAEIAQLKNNIKTKEQALKLAEKNTAELAQSISALQVDKKKITERLAKVAPNEGPTIAIRWPKLVNPSDLTAQVPSGSVVNIVGAVYPPNTVTEFMINGKPEQLDVNGLFLKPVEVADTDVELVLSAIDDLGKKTESTLRLQTETNRGALDQNSVALTVPKIKFGKYYALVIGNTGYDTSKGWQPLRTAGNDAKAIATILKEKYGFKVTLKLNTSRDEMLISLEEMRKKLTENDNLLIYYAGHGYMDPDNDQGYWIPVNGATDSTINWVSNATITDQIRAMNARNVMVVADSCYSASLMRSGMVTLRSGLSPQKKLQRLQDDVKAITRMALSSGGLQPVADAIDGSGHSVFANAVLKSLKNNKSILDGDTLATEVGLNVSVATHQNIKQVPRYAPLAKGGHQGGEFYFVSRLAGR